ncbi:MAG: class I SAM-dependent methyltransferase [Bacteroidales bacterium]|jgi:SAM-dependent methyltransferase
MNVVDKHGFLERIGYMEKVVLELGCGTRKFDQNAIGIDRVDMDSVDIVCDLEEGLPFIKDESVDLVCSFHTLEHIGNIEFVMREIYRVLKKGGKTSGTVPHFSNPYYYSDYTHKTPFGLYTFSYFTKKSPLRRKVPTHYNELDFTITKLKIVFYSPFKFRNISRKIFTFIFNSSVFMKEWYEGSLSGFLPAHELFFELEKN